MNWSKWYAEQSNPAAFAVFWAATGERPKLTDLFAQTGCKRQEIGETAWHQSREGAKDVPRGREKGPT